MKLNDYLVNETNLKKFGFKKEKDDFKFVTKADGMKTVFCIDDNFNNLTVDVFDGDSDEKFLPFYQKTKSEYVANIVKEVEKLQNEIIQKCFHKTDVQKEIFNWIKIKWPNLELTTWEKFPNDIGIKDGTTKKWFGLFAKVKTSTLYNSKTKSDDLVWVLNLKLDDEVNSTIDHKQYFPAYHMNKKNWASVLLNKDTNIPVVKELIKESYENATN